MRYRQLISNDILIETMDLRRGLGEGTPRQQGEGIKMTRTIKIDDKMRRRLDLAKIEMELRGYRPETYEDVLRAILGVFSN